MPESPSFSSSVDHGKIQPELGGRRHPGGEISSSTRRTAGEGRFTPSPPAGSRRGGWLSRPLRQEEEALLLDLGRGPRSCWNLFSSAAWRAPSHRRPKASIGTKRTPGAATGSSRRSTSPAWGKGRERLPPHPAVAPGDDSLLQHGEGPARNAFAAGRAGPGNTVRPAFFRCGPVPAAQQSTVRLDRGRKPSVPCQGPAARISSDARGHRYVSGVARLGNLRRPSRGPDKHRNPGRSMSPHLPAHKPPRPCAPCDGRKNSGFNLVRGSGGRGAAAPSWASWIISPLLDPAPHFAPATPPPS